MTTADMRGHVIAAYPGAGEVWKKKVLAMSDGQVLAMFRSLQKRKRIK
jgi:hypothetical protein